MEVIREPQTKEEWEQAYIVVLKRAHDAERKLAAALADPVLRGEIENAAYERAAMVCEDKMSYDESECGSDVANDCAAAIRALKK